MVALLSWSVDVKWGRSRLRSNNDSSAQSTQLALLLQNHFAVGVLEVPQPRQERKPKQIIAQCSIRQDHCGNVAHYQVADLDHVELDRCGMDHTVGGLDQSPEVDRGRMNAEPSG